jgi:hypothetical protein
VAAINAAATQAALGAPAQPQPRKTAGRYALADFAIERTYVYDYAGLMADSVLARLVASTSSAPVTMVDSTPSRCSARKKSSR